MMVTQGSLLAGCALLAAASLVAAAGEGARDLKAVSVTVDHSQRLQTIDGFGFCEAFQRAHAVHNLPPAQQAQVLDLLFSRTVGAGMSIVRVGLGSSPNSTLDHMNSIEPAAPADLSPLSTPEYVWDGNDSSQVWIAQRARDYGVDMFYADAWSAPGYMKTNGRDDQGGWLCGVRGHSNCTTGSWIKAYADYLVQYTKYYISEGVPIKYLGFLNEPNLIKQYATMQSDGYQAAEVVLPLRDSLAHANLSSVGIACCEGQGWSMQRELTAQVQQAGAEGYLSLTTTHAYKGEPAAPDRPLDTSLKVWITENSPIMQRLGMTGTWHRNGSENEGLAYANNLHTAFTTGNVSAYVYWIGAGPSRMEAPLVWIPRRNDSTPDDEPWFYLAANYWAFAQWSRFIRPDAARLAVESSAEKSSAVGDVAGPVLASAYRNRDGSVVVQAINNGDEAVALDLDVRRHSGARPYAAVSRWLTDNAHNMTHVGMATPEAGGHLDAELPARSLVTFLIEYERKDP